MSEKSLSVEIKYDEVRCRVQRYLPDQTESPYRLETVDEFLTRQPQDDYLGEQFYKILQMECIRLGHTIKFYTMSDEPTKYKYDVVIYPED